MEIIEFNSYFISASFLSGIMPVGMTEVALSIRVVFADRVLQIGRSCVFFAPNTAIGPPAVFPEALVLFECALLQSTCRALTCHAVSLVYGFRRLIEMIFVGISIIKDILGAMPQSRFAGITDVWFSVFRRIGVLTA